MPDLKITWPLMQSQVRHIFGTPAYKPQPSWIQKFVLGDLAPHFSHVKSIYPIPITGVSGFVTNELMLDPLRAAFEALASKELNHELKTFDGCWVIRMMKGAPNLSSMHSWGLAVDFNAAQNPFGGKPTWSDGFIHCFLDNGFEWGGVWQPASLRDGMHFQLPWIKVRTGPYAPRCWRPKI